MKTFKSKLNSNTGASIILALLFLLFAMAVGSVILTAASVNLGRTNAMTTQEQNYLAVKSAASLIEDELSELNFVTEHVIEKEYSTNTVNAVSSLTSNLVNKDPLITDIPAYAQNLILPELKAIFDNNIGASTGYTAKNLDLEFDLADFPKVYGNVKIDDVYNIEISLWSKSDTSSTQNNNLKLTLLASKSEVEEVSYDDPVAPTKETNKYTTTVSYPNPTITKGGDN